MKFEIRKALKKAGYSDEVIREIEEFYKMPSKN
jgi:hypothetical protein